MCKWHVMCRWVGRLRDAGMEGWVDGPMEGCACSLARSLARIVRPIGHRPSHRPSPAASFLIFIRGSDTPKPLKNHLRTPLDPDPKTPTDDRPTDPTDESRSFICDCILSQAIRRWNIGIIFNLAKDRIWQVVPWVDGSYRIHRFGHH